MALNGECLAEGRMTQLWEAIIEEVRGRRISRSLLDRKNKYRLQRVSVLEEQVPRERSCLASLRSGPAMESEQPQNHINNQHVCWVIN